VKCDRILSAAYSHELTKYGVKIGLTNYAAAYATGLLLARRVLAKLGMSDKYEGMTKKEAVGKYFAVEEIEGERRPFYVILDVGLNRTTTGAKIFSALKGAADGGINIPHSTTMKQFPGYNKESGKFDSRVLRKYIFAGHVADHMKKLREKDEESYRKQFADYIKAGVEPEHLEPMWAKAHELIRKDPSYVPKKKLEKPVHKRYKPRKKNLKQRKDRIKQKLAALQKAVLVT